MKKNEHEAWFWMNGVVNSAIKHNEKKFVILIFSIIRDDKQK